jgi:hypothetical protein
LCGVGGPGGPRNHALGLHFGSMGPTKFSSFVAIAAHLRCSRHLCVITPRQVVVAVAVVVVVVVVVVAVVAAAAAVVVVPLPGS